MIVLKNTCVNLVLSIFNLPLSYYRSNVKERMKTRLCEEDVTLLFGNLQKGFTRNYKSTKIWKIVKKRQHRNYPKCYKCLSLQRDFGSTEQNNWQKLDENIIL